MFSALPPAKAILTYGEIWRSLRVRDWESDWREHFGVHTVTGHPNATLGLAQILVTLNALKPNCNEVILPAYANPALAATIRQVGLEPCLVDMDIMTTSPPADLRSAINPSTLTILTTNLFGAPDPVEEVASICKDAGIFLIEDVSLALGAYASDQELGSFGDAVFFSLDINSVITTIFGGIVCWRNPSLTPPPETNTELKRINWRAFVLQLFHPVLVNRFFFGLLEKAPLVITQLLGKLYNTAQPKWSHQQAKLSALLIPKIEIDAKERLRICGIIKQHEAQFGRDLLRREAQPKLTQYPCIASSETERDAVLRRLKKIGVTGTGGFRNIGKLVDLTRIPKTAVLVSRLFTVPCYPGLSQKQINRMLAEIDQSDEAISSWVQKKYSALATRHGSRPEANGHTPAGLKLRKKLLALQLDKLPKRSLSVLDSGCGNGSLGPFLREHLKIGGLDGADFVGESLQIAHERFKYSQTYLTNVMAIDTAAAGKKYDFVNSSDVLQYIPPDEYERFFGAHRNCLLPGGHLLLTLPNLKTIYTLAPKSKRTFEYDFSPDDVLSAISDSGFKILSIMGSDIFGMARFDLVQGILGSVKRLFSGELSVLCEAE